MDEDGGFSSFQPPAGDTAARYPSWVLLQRYPCHFADDDDSKNATTAEARLHTGRTVRSPSTSPLLRPSPTSAPRSPDKTAMDSFVRLPSSPPRETSCSSTSPLPAPPHRKPQWDQGASRVPRLQGWRRKRQRQPVDAQANPASLDRSLYSQCLHLACDDDDGEFLLAALVSTKSITSNELCTFSSKTGQWSTTTRLELVMPPETELSEVPSSIDKVIVFGGGVVGWVDLWKGIKICNVLHKDPALYFIPLPNAEFDQDQRGRSQQIRNVILREGVLMFVEIDCRSRKVLGVCDNKKSCKKMTNDFDSTDIIYDSEILFRNYARMEPIPVLDGWKIRTCDRHASWDYWRKGHIVDFDDLHDSTPEYLSDGSAGQWALRDLTTGYPILSIAPGDDVVCLMSKVKPSDKRAWMIGLHLGKKTLEVLQPYSAPYFERYNSTFLACAFSAYLNTTPSSVSSTLGV